MIDQDSIILTAYNLFKEDMDPKIDSQALLTLNKFHDAINEWDGNLNNLQNISFYLKYLVGPDMENIASSGSATARYDVFKSIMSKKGTAKKVGNLLLLRKKGPLNEGLINKITEVGLINFVLNHSLIEGNRPSIYINRFLLSIFIEIMTVIASDKQLKETARLLGINPTGVSFERLQVQVRTIIDSSLTRQGIGNELSKFSRAAVAYYIVEAGERQN